MEIRKIAGWAAAAATAFSLLYQFPAKASGPLISGLQEPGEAEGPALAGNEEEEIKTVTASISEENLNDGLIEYEELESLIRTGNSSAVTLLSLSQRTMKKRVMNSASGPPAQGISEIGGKPVPGCENVFLSYSRMIFSRLSCFLVVR